MFHSTLGLKTLFTSISLPTTTNTTTEENETKEQPWN